MRSRINHASQLKAVTTFIEARYYNRIRLALARLESPLRIELANMRGLDIIIDENEWVCVDRSVGDEPSLAWTDFDTINRQGLHAPVACKLRFFHNHADLICGSVLQLVNRNIEDRLYKKRLPHQRANVVYLSNLHSVQ